MSHNHVISAKTCNIIDLAWLKCKNMTSVQVCACGVHMRCMCKAWLSTFGSMCVKHTPNDQNMINKSNHGNLQSLVPIGVQNNIKMSFWHFIKHSVCTYKTNMWAMHEHEWILPKYMLNCHNWPTQTQTDQMGQSPIKKLKKISKNLKFPNPFSKQPNSSKI